MFRSILPLVASACLLATAVAPAQAAPLPATLVVFVGGVGSTTANAELNFGPLVRELIVGQHVAVNEFVYGGSSAAYTAERSCQPIAQSVAELVAFLRNVRDTQGAASVVLVGHSNGGVSQADADLYGRSVGPCAAVDDLYARHETPGWADYLVRLVQWEQSLGTDVRAVANFSDVVVSLDEQQVAGLDVNYVLNASVYGAWTSHGALLHAPEVLPQLAAIVAGG